MRIVVLVSLTLAFVLIFASGPMALPTEQAGFDSQLTDDETAAEIAARALKPAPLLSSAVVFLFFYLRFSEWPRATPAELAKRPPRYYTTPFRYQTAATVYGILMVGVFLIIYLFPSAFLGALDAFQGGASVTTALAQSLPAMPPQPAAPTNLASILSSLAEFTAQQRDWLYGTIVFVIVIWPKLPFSGDELLRGTLQRFAQIPTEAHILVNRLRLSDDAFVPDGKEIGSVLGASTLLQEDDFKRSEHPDRLCYRYAKLVYLLHRFRGEITQRNIVAAALDQPDRYEDFLSGAKELAVQLGDFRASLISELREADADKLNAFLEKTDPITRTPPLSPLLEQMQALTMEDASLRRYIDQRMQSLAAQVDRLLDDLYYFIVTSIISTEPSPRVRVARFQRLGIAIESGYLPFDEGNALTYMMVVLVIAILCPTLMYHVIPGFMDVGAINTVCGYLIPEDGLEALRWSVVGATQHGLAIASAFVLIFAIQQGRGENLAPSGGPEPGGHFRSNASATAAFVNGAGIAFSVNVAFLAVLMGMDVGNEVRQQCGLQTNWVWSLPPALTGGATALMLQYPRQHRLVLGRAMLQGAITGLVAAAVAMIFLESTVPSGADQTAAWAYEAGRATGLGERLFSNTMLETLTRGGNPFLAYSFFTGFSLGTAAGFVVLQLTGELFPAVGAAAHGAKAAVTHGEQPVGRP